MTNVVERMGEMALRIPAQRGERNGALRAARGEGAVMAAYVQSRIAAKRATCKTCKGTGCTGHCKF